MPFYTVRYKMSGGRKWTEQCVCMLEAYFLPVRNHYCWRKETKRAALKDSSVLSHFKQLGDLGEETVV